MNQVESRHADTGTHSKGTYSYLMDNMKMVLIILVVFNHLIAFCLVGTYYSANFVCYGITMFHMPAFIFVSGYLSKRMHSPLENMKSLLIPYVLYYCLIWACCRYIYGEEPFRLLIPIAGSWYFLTLFVYRMTIQGVSKVRRILPLSILFALVIGSQDDFSLFLSASRIVVYLPFFVAGFFWKAEQTDKLRQSKWKWLLLLLGLACFIFLSYYMIREGISIRVLKQDRNYVKNGVSITVGIITRALMYVGAFSITFALLGFLPEKKLPLSFIGKNSVSIYFFHLSILRLINYAGFFKHPLINNWPANILVTFATVLILGSKPVNQAYKWFMNKVNRIIFSE